LRPPEIIAVNVGIECSCSFEDTAWARPSFSISQSGCDGIAKEFRFSWMTEKSRARSKRIGAAVRQSAYFVRGSLICAYGHFPAKMRRLLWSGGK